MVDKEAVAELMDQIRQPLRAHGGDVTLVEVTDDGIVKVVMEGACRGCPMATMTIRQGIEARLKEQMPDIKEVVAVESEQ